MYKTAAPEIFRGREARLPFAWGGSPSGLPYGYARDPALNP